MGGDLLLRKWLVISVFLVIFLAATLSFAVFAQSQTPSTASSNVVTYANGGNVILSLPQGVPSHPVNLRIAVSDISDKSDFGGPDVMQVSVWAPALNTYVQVAILSTNTDPAAIAWIKGVVNATPVWSPPALQNYFVLAADQLQVWMDGPILMANLTTSVSVTLPDALGGNFTIPPMTLMFRPIDSGFVHDETIVLAKPQFSGWTINSTHVDVPSWVRVIVPAWLGSTHFETVGTQTIHGTTTYIPPAV